MLYEDGSEWQWQTLTYYDTVRITAAKSFIVQAPAVIFTGKAGAYPRVTPLKEFFLKTSLLTDALPRTVARADRGGHPPPSLYVPVGRVPAHLAQPGPRRQRVDLRRQL
jgi:hypothetical protein